MGLILVRMHNYNLPAICSGDITYLVEDDSFLKELEEQEPIVIEKDIEIIGERYFEMDELCRVAFNGFDFESELKIKDIKVRFIWVSIMGNNYRAYQMMGQVFSKSIFTGEWTEIKSAYGNQVFRSDGNRFTGQCYHICDAIIENMEEDISGFNAEEYQYNEFLEDILGDAG